MTEANSLTNNLKQATNNYWTEVMKIAEEKENQIKQKDDELQQKDAELQQAIAALQQKETELQQKNAELESAALDKSKLEKQNKKLQDGYAKLKEKAGLLKVEKDDAIAVAEQLELELDNERKENENALDLLEHHQKNLLEHLLKALAKDTTKVANDTVLIKILTPPPESPDDFSDTVLRKPLPALVNLESLKKSKVGKEHLIIGRESGLKPKGIPYEVIDGGLSLEDVDVSGLQAVISHDGDTYTWQDLGSTNGSTAFFLDPDTATGVRQVEVEPTKRVTLKSGMLKKVGNCILYIRMGKTTKDEGPTTRMRYGLDSFKCSSLN